MVLLSNDISKETFTKKKTSFFLYSFDTIYTLISIVLLLICLGYSGERILDFPISYLILTMNGILSVYGMITSIKRNASIHFVSFMFCYLFLTLTPIIQVAANIDPVFSIDFIVLITTSISFIFIFTGVVFTQKINNDVSEVRADHQDKAENNNYALLFCFTLSVSLFSIFLFRDGLFTSREGLGNLLATIFEDQVVALICLVLLKFIPIFGSTIGLRSALRNKKVGMIILFSVLLILALIINNPMSSPRYYLAAIAFFFIDYMTYGKKVRWLAVLVIVGILSAPLFHVFRREHHGPRMSQEKTLLDKTFLSMDYDAFQTASYTVLTVRNDGVVWGANIAGAMLFFAPRKLWPEKPPVTGWVIYNTMLKHRFIGTANISTPLVAEGYYAFSWLGAIAISLIYWFLITLITRISLDRPKSPMFLFRSIFTGLVLILLRGALTVGMSAIAGFSIAAFLPWMLFYLSFNKGQKEILEKSQKGLMKNTGSL